jgi:DNA primase large subunit
MAHKIRKALVEAPGVEAVRFSKLPTTIDLFAEFIVLTGFVRVAQEEILEICTESTGRSMTLLKANKYEIEMELDEILPVLPEEPKLKRKGV